MGGWGVRPSDWGFVASVQQQVLPRTSVEISYTRRWLNSFHRHRQPDDVDRPTTRPFSITAPADARLGDASGQVINGLFNVQQDVGVAARTTSTTLAADIGNQYQHFNGILLNVPARACGTD